MIRPTMKHGCNSLKHLRNTLVLFLVLSAAAGLSGCRNGTTQTLENWQLTVFSSKMVTSVSDSHKIYKPADGNVYLTVSVSAKNIGPIDDVFLPSDTSSGYISVELQAQRSSIIPSQLLFYKNELANTYICTNTGKQGILTFTLPQTIINEKNMRLVFTMNNKTVGFDLH